MSPNRVREIRERRGMKQSALARQVGISQAEISRIEQGQHEPGVYLALRVAGALGVTVDALFPLVERGQLGR